METFELMKWTARLILASTIALAVFRGFQFLQKNTQQSENTFCAVLRTTLKKRGKAFLSFTIAAFATAIFVPLANLDEKTSAMVLRGLNIFWIVLAAWAATILVNIISDVTRKKFDITVPDNLTARQMHTKIKVFQRILVVLLWLAAVAGIMLLFERFRTLGGTLLASAGVVSILIGLSAQKTFAAIIAGIQVALFHPINLDDVVVLEGEWGHIEEITFSYVVVKTWDLRRLVVPVTYFLEKPFQNWTKTSAEIIGSVFIHTDYTVPMETLRDELKQICNNAGSLWDGKTCVLQVVDSGPETLTLRAIMSSPDASKAWDLRCMVREGLIGYLQENHPTCLPKQRMQMQDSPKNCFSSP